MGFLVFVLTRGLAGCAEGCPPGYRQEADQCVVSEAERVCSVLPATKPDPQGSGVLVRLDIPGNTCAWIDQTEVTVEAYQAWLDAVPAESVEWNSTWCQWKRKQVRTDPAHAAPGTDVCVEAIPSLDTGRFAPDKPI